ncbi:hypothetical protein Pd630_LPD04447 [Rhodococcus opacus PD630]|nr:hypothetical protein Pd630_LPD04447 [Rhodococcus opacus PD630]
MTLAEMLDLEQLAAACAADGVYDFQYRHGPPCTLENEASIAALDRAAHSSTFDATQR